MFCIREQAEQQESLWLSSYAALSSASKGRQKEELPCTIRTDYARDRDRIVHASAFRRLKHKTQVFFAPLGDHYRTRLTHTLEVSQIARTIARALRLNEDLTEAIAMGHDLGHTPFGHSGESALNEIAPFAFLHSEQSLRVVDKLERGGRGLNLTFEVRDGIVSHSFGGGQATTLEGKVVAYADKIAYMNHDIDDAIRAGILRADNLPRLCVEVLGNTKSKRITTMIQAIVHNSTDKASIELPEQTLAAHYALRDFLFEVLYHNKVVRQEEPKVVALLHGLYTYFKQNPQKLPEDYQVALKEEPIDRVVCDYIACMSDSYAVELYKNLFIPKNFC